MLQAIDAESYFQINNFHFTPQWGKMKICDFPYDMIAQVTWVQHVIYFNIK